MRILFVFYNIGSGISFSPAIQTLSAIAKAMGHQTKLIHFHEKLTPNDPDIYLPKAKEFNPDLICFTSTDFEYNKIREIAEIMKQEFTDVAFMLGGKAAIELATKEIKETPFDIFCMGEAEVPFMELLNKMIFCWISSNIEGLWFKIGDEFIKNSLGKNITNLDSLPFMDYDIFETEKIIEGKSGWLSVQFSRGCMFNCTFCFVTADKYNLFDKSKGENKYGMENYLRNVSVEYAIEFLESLAEKYKGIKIFNLDDELPQTIEMHKGKGYSWWLSFCKQYKERIYDKYGINFVCNGRISVMTEEIIKAQVEAGCLECRMGFESGSWRIRKDILDKPITEEMMKKCYALCDKYGLKTSSFTMIGYPTETDFDIHETLRLTAELKPYIIRLTFCYPFENTRLWFSLKDTDLVEWDKLYAQSGYFEEPVIKTEIPKQKLMAYRFLFPWYVNAMMLEKEYSGIYLAQIVNHEDDDFTKPETKREIIIIDKELSQLCDPLPHYAYFPNNTAYFYCKNKVI